MKIAVYTICKDEAKFAQRWSGTTRDADVVLVVDTGSTDGTPDILRRSSVTVEHISLKPWRFDDARNAALLLLPPDVDIAVSLDMDETMPCDWRLKLENAWLPDTTRLKYRYVWNWTADGDPDLVFFSDKISGRFTHRWKAPVHEVLVPTVPEVINVCEDVLIEHHPDATKSRSQYLPLLELAVKEDPHDDRNSHYLGREYFFHRQWRSAINELQRHLALPEACWQPERAASMRYIAKCHDALNELSSAREWYIRATLEDVASREALVDAAKFFLKQDSFHMTMAYCERALQLPANVGNYMEERYAQREGAHDLMSVASYHLGLYDTALRHAKTALAMNPHDRRLKSNHDLVRRRNTNG